VIFSDATVTIDSADANRTVTATEPSGETMLYADSVSNYGISTSSSSVLVQDKGTGGTDSLNGLDAIQFADTIDIIAQTPPKEWSPREYRRAYGAVFGREPDVAGLTFYETYLKSHPATPITQFANGFSHPRIYRHLNA